MTRVIVPCLVLLMLLPHVCLGAASRKQAAAKGAVMPMSRPKPPAGYRPAPPQGVRAEANEWSVDISWRKSRDLHVSRYAVYVEADGEDDPAGGEVKLERLAETEGLSFREEGLEPDTEYTYWVTAVASNGAESEPAIVETATLPVTRPPLEMDVLDMHDLFTNNYKLYETEGIGRVRIRNNTPERIARLKVTFTARNLMDFPSEQEIRDMEPHESRDVTLKAVLTNRVLEIPEDTPLQTEIKLSYYFNGQLRSFTTSRTLMLHEKHRMVWKDPDMAAVFVTPKDAPVLDLSRAVVTRIGDSASPLVLAGAIYETMGALGITYVRDPSNPYQISDGRVDTVDYVQYPVETLMRRSGDCKGMVVLYSSLLESIGIRTIMLDYPGHMFLMFAVAKGSAAPQGDLAGLLFPHDGELWAPVELTLVGSTFLTAWERGSRQFLEWTAKKGLGMMDVRNAWKRYKPATLPPQLWRPPVVTRRELEQRFGEELTLLRRLTVQAASPALFDALRSNPRDYRALLQLGIRFGEEGDAAESSKYLNRAAELAPRSADLLNNLGNLHLLEGNNEKALELYRQAAELDPADPHILVNLARCRLRLGNREAARDAFSRATKLQPGLAERYRALALELAY